MLDLSTESAADRVYAEVKELILTNVIAGGELISEGEIAQRCEVSRTPVREAFLRLQAEGWMRLYPKRGALVCPVTETEAHDVIDARILVETHAVRGLAANPMPLDDLLTRLRRNLDAHGAVPADHIADFGRLDAEFHQIIVAAGHNGLLADFYLGLGERHRRMTTASMHRDPAVVGRILTEHAELVTAIEARDVAQFDSMLRRHIASVHQVPAHRIPGGAGR
ncbi:GntR family transcriptional regulator [Gordonia sp. NPDC003425]